MLMLRWRPKSHLITKKKVNLLCMFVFAFGVCPALPYCRIYTIYTHYTKLNSHLLSLNDIVYCNFHGHIYSFRFRNVSILDI